MRSLIRHVLGCMLFGAIVLLADRGLYALLSNRFSGLETAGLSEMIRSDAEIVILGSSRACHHYNPEVVEDLTGMSVFNTGRDGLGTPYMRGVCDVLLNTCKPKTLIIEVDASSILSRYASRQIKRAACLAPYMDESEVVREMILAQGFRQKVKYMSMAYRYNGLPMYLLYDVVKKDKFVKGFEALDRSYIPDDVQVRADGAAEGSRADFSEELIGMLRDIIRTAGDKGINVVLMTSPRWGGLGGYGRDDKEALSFVRELANAEGVPYVIVMEEEYAQLRDAGLFADPSHLNRRGARVYSEIVASILIEEGLAARRSDQHGR